MPLMKLNAEWTDLMHKYEGDHQDPRNQACHKVGIPLIAALSLLVPTVPLAIAAASETPRGSPILPLPTVPPPSAGGRSLAYRAVVATEH